jgi:hypothetical protein
MLVGSVIHTVPHVLRPDARFVYIDGPVSPLCHLACMGSASTGVDPASVAVVVCGPTPLVDHAHVLACKLGTVFRHEDFYM